MCLDEYELRVGLNYDRFQEKTPFNKKGDWCIKSTRKKQPFEYCRAAKLLCQNSHDEKGRQ